MPHHSPVQDAVIAITELTKNFGNIVALDQLNLTVRRGEVHGFLGPNGAGKSTALRILLGILRKTSGTVQVFGSDPWRDAVSLHRNLAYVPGDVNLWPNLSGGEAIDLFGSLRGGINKKRRADLLDRFQLDPTKKCRTYSKGNRQKVALVAALAADVDLYILDEPTSGLDPLMEMTFQSYVRELKTQGKTILLSSHILAEAEALCDRLTIIRDGKAVESGTLAELRHLTRTSIKVETARPIINLRPIPGLYNLEIQGTRATFEVEAHTINQMIEHLLPFEITQLVSSPPSLEELFLRQYNQIVPVREED